VKDKIILELGTGIGTDAALLVENGAKYYGIELSPESLKLARMRFEIFGLTGEFENISIEEFRYPSSLLKPDLVYSFGVIHHTVDPEAALTNIVKQMKSGCEFKIMVYAKNSWKMAMIESGLDRYEAQNGVPIAYTYTKLEAISLINNSGLELVDIKQDHCFMYDIEKYKNNEYALQPHFAAMSEEMLTAVKKELGWHLLINAIKP
jgi:SAM-dependent methyltransferase